MTNFNHAVVTEADDLRRALREVINDAERALEAMDSGERPGVGIKGRIFGNTVDKAEAACARLNLLLNYAGTDLLPTDTALAALRGERV